MYQAMNLGWKVEEIMINELFWCAHGLHSCIIKWVPHLVTVGAFYAQGLFLCLSSERCFENQDCM